METGEQNIGKQKLCILGIESSCDDTSAAIVVDGKLLSNVIASQAVHSSYGGVIPELASRAHQQNIVPAVHEAVKRAGISVSDISAVAYTRGPGLIGSLLVGTSFAKGLAVSLGLPLIDVNHLQAHILAHFIQEPGQEHEVPGFPFICLLVSGGNSQIVLVRGFNDFEILGQTIDDAAGEAFDKCAKVLGGPYPGGPYVDKTAKDGDDSMFKFAKPHVPGLDYSFSGLKTSFLYLVRDNLKTDPGFVEKHRGDLCASFQRTVVECLMQKLKEAFKQHKVECLALAGGVSANSALRKALTDFCEAEKVKAFVPKISYTTDNAAMIATAALYQYRSRSFDKLDSVPFARAVV